MAALVRRRHSVCFALFAFALAATAMILAPVARAAPGDLDPTFGIGGSERLFTNPEDLFLGAVATQPDGKIVLAGADEAGALVVRLREDGALDPSFGSDGIVSSPVTGMFPGARAVAVQPDGKIVIAGSTQVAGNREFLVARFLPDGQLDSSFAGGAGSLAFPVGPKSAQAEAVAIGAGGRILVTGEAQNATSNRIAAVAVLRPDGQLDPTFGIGGVTTVESTVGNDQGEGIAEAPDGGILIADQAGAGSGHGFVTLKLLPSGMPDPGFGTAGVVQTPIPGSNYGRSDSLAVMPDGRIVVAGYGYDEPAPSELDTKFAAARYLADGKLDPSFGAGTGVFAEQLGVGDDSARAVGLTPSGKPVLAGEYEVVAGNSSPVALRLTVDGVLDPTFGGGIVKRPVLAPFGDTFKGAALDSRERLVIVSNAYEGNNIVSVEVTRILGDIPPSPPATVVPGPGPSSPPPPANKPPHARIIKPGRTVSSNRLKGFAGTASDPDGDALREVQIALVRKVPRPRKAHATATAAKAIRARSCLDLRNAKGSFKMVSGKLDGPCPLLWLDAKGTSRWSFKLVRRLAPGKYVLYARAVDAQGLEESTFSAAAGNRLAFRITPPSRS